MDDYKALDELNKGAKGGEKKEGGEESTEEETESKKNKKMVMISVDDIPKFKSQLLKEKFRNYLDIRD